MTILSWFFNEFSKDCRSYFFTFDFARDENIMIGNERTRVTRLYCRWCAVRWCYKHVDRRCDDWQTAKTWRRNSSDSNLISLWVIEIIRRSSETYHFTFRSTTIINSLRLFTLILFSLNSYSVTASIRSRIKLSISFWTCKRDESLLTLHYTLASLLTLNVVTPCSESLSISSLNSTIVSCFRSRSFSFLCISIIS